MDYYFSFSGAMDGTTCGEGKLCLRGSCIRSVQALAGRHRITDPCSPNPCMNGGGCAQLGSLGYLCVCAGEFFGHNCLETRRPTTAATKATTFLQGFSTSATAVTKATTFIQVFTTTLKTNVRPLQPAAF